MKNNFIVQYFAGAWKELHKVNWPSRNEVVYHTVIVFISSLIAIGITSAIDYGLTYLVQYLVENKG